MKLPRPLHKSYKIFTHGGNYWRDIYLLEKWDELVQPVIYRDHVYHGYKFLRRLGSWCWLTKDPRTGEFLTVKFLNRGETKELQMSQYIQKHCSSPFVSAMREHFVIPHHLHQTSTPRFKDVSFQAIVYPTTGICIGRIYDQLEYHGKTPDLPLSLERRRKYIGQLIRGMTALHNIGVVHADLHPGNVVLDPPSKAHMAQLLATPPLEHDVRLKDGSVPPPWMPSRSTEPENIGFSPSGIRIIDFGYSFIPEDGAVYTAADFPTGNPPPPEILVGDKATTQPFKADSWYLGQTMYFILTGGSLLFRRCIGCDNAGLLKEAVLGIEELRAGEDEVMNELPEDVRSRYVPVILGLLELDPGKRLAIRDLDPDDRCWGSARTK